MNVINTIDVYVFSLLILAFIFANTNKRAEHAFFQHRLFLYLIGVLAMLLVIDATARIADGMPGACMLYINWSSNLLLYLTVPLGPCLWVLYADYQIFHDEKRIRQTTIPLAAYCLVNAAVTLSSPYTGWFFTIETDNVYQRGPLFILHIGFIYLLMAYTFILIISNRKKIASIPFYALLLFAVPPALAGLLQSIYYGLALVLGASTLSILLLYFSIQDKRLDTDYLTGVYNRRLLDHYINDKIRLSTNKKSFAAILIDLNGFKTINDVHGHITGDEALLHAVTLLKGCLRRSDFIARYGGDEFLIVLDIGREDVLKEAEARIHAAFHNFNQTSNLPYRLCISYGSGVYDPAAGLDAARFLGHIDGLMYQNKNKA